MLFTDIRLQNFRSYSDASFELGEKVTIIVGPNAAGKTNLLEAVKLISSGKTYRPSENLIKTGNEWARIDIHSNDNSLRTVKLVSSEPGDKKEFEIDKKIYKILPFPQKQPVVLFEPNHLFLLHGEPQNRRNYLDDSLETLEVGYAKLRSDYRRIIVQRNSLLKRNTGDTSLIFAWNVRLIEAASQIVAKRLELVDKINEKLSETYSKIAGQKSQAKLEYKSSIIGKNYSAQLLNKLENDIKKDLTRGFTGHGPHRDDFVCWLGDRVAHATGSRGEVRTIILSLKIIELQRIEDILERKPILLLDDVFSELDGARRKALVSFLKNHQTIITTTDADIVTKNFSQKCHIIPLS